MKCLIMFVVFMKGKELLNIVKLVKNFYVIYAPKNMKNMKLKKKYAKKMKMKLMN